MVDLDDDGELVVDFITMLSGLSGIVALMHQLVNEMQGDKRAELNDLIRRDLRVIRFRDDGVLRLLRKMRDEIAVTDTEWRALVEFNDYQWEVERAIRRLGRSSDSTGLNLTLANMRILEKVGSMKSGLRRALQEELNYLPRENPVLQQQRASELVTHIETLNNEIERLESAIAN